MKVKEEVAPNDPPTPPPLLAYANGLHTGIKIEAESMQTAAMKHSLFSYIDSKQMLALWVPKYLMFHPPTLAEIY